MLENKPKKIFDFTFMIAIVPAYIYFVCFLYELAFCNRFSIPAYLIDPNLTTILLFATSVLTILISSLKLLGFSLPLFKAANNKEKSHLSLIYGLNGGCVFGAILMIYAYPISWGLFIGIGAFLLFVNLISWIIPLIFRLREKNTIKEKLEEIQNETDDSDLLLYLLKNRTYEERIFILILIMIPLFSYLFGDGQALSQTTFQTLQSDKNVVVLKKYGDIFVCSKFNRKTKVVSNDLVLIKISDSEPLILKIEKLGPLN